MKHMIFAAAAMAAVGLSGCVEPTSGGGGNRWVDVQNDTGRAVVWFYASASNQNNWGPDQLGSNVLSPGQSIAFNFDDGTGACLFDFKFEDRNRNAVEAYQVNVCTVGAFQLNSW